jgi:hypothetical protein
VTTRRVNGQVTLSVFRRVLRPVVWRGESQVLFHLLDAGFAAIPAHLVATEGLAGGSPNLCGVDQYALDIAAGREWVAHDLDRL